MDDEMIIRVLKALGDPTRLRVVAFLARCCCGRAAIREDGGVEGPTAGEVCCHISGVERITSTISHHLHELADAEVIRIERRGKTALCTLVPETLLVLSSHLTKLASGGDQGSC
jgi:DNA-binding transcriptional ArsR family regulator